MDKSLGTQINTEDEKIKNLFHRIVFEFADLAQIKFIS